MLAQGNQLDDPWRQLRRISTKRQLEMLDEAPVRDNLAAVPADALAANSIASVRRMLNYVELSRLLCLSAMRATKGKANPALVNELLAKKL